MNILYLLDLHENAMDEVAANADKNLKVNNDKKDVIRDEYEVERDVTGIIEDLANDDGEDGGVVITRPHGDARSHIDVDVSHRSEEKLKVLEVEREDTRVKDRVAEDQSIGRDVGHDVLTDDADDPKAIGNVEEPQVDQEDENTAGEDNSWIGG